MNTSSKVYVAKLAGLSVFDPLGDRVGVVRDVVSVFRATGRPRIVGLVTEVPGKRRVFVPMTRVTSMDATQIITTGLVNMRRFEKRQLETLMIGEMLDRRIVLRDGSGPGTVEDVGISQMRSGEWEISRVFLRRGEPKRGLAGHFRRSGETLVVPYEDVDGLFRRPVGGQSGAMLAASFDGMKPADVAERLKDFPEERRREIAAEMPDSQLADVIEELGEDDQIALLEGLNEERVADVLEQMQPDDAADLLAELPPDQQQHLLELMEPDDADDVRRLMAYDEYTAGGLMTTVPVILPPEATVAEALAHVRREDLSPTIAAAVFVCRPPLETPTGKYLGVAHIQRMLREAPHKHVGSIIDTDLESLAPEAPLSAVSRMLATYNLVSLPVTDPDGRLIGVVTVDDVLDHMLPDDWRNADDIHTDPRTGQITRIQPVPRTDPTDAPPGAPHSHRGQTHG